MTTAKPRKYHRGRVALCAAGYISLVAGLAAPSNLIGVPLSAFGGTVLLVAGRAYATAPLLEARTARDLTAMTITGWQKDHALDRYRALLEYNARLEQTIRELRHPSGRPPGSAGHSSGGIGGPGLGGPGLGGA